MGTLIKVFIKSTVWAKMAVLRILIAIVLFFYFLPWSLAVVAGGLVCLYVFGLIASRKPDLIEIHQGEVPCHPFAVCRDKNQILNEALIIAGAFKFFRKRLTWASHGSWFVNIIMAIFIGPRPRFYIVERREWSDDSRDHMTRVGLRRWKMHFDTIEEVGLDKDSVNRSNHGDAWFSIRPEGSALCLGWLDGPLSGCVVEYRIIHKQQSILLQAPDLLLKF